MNKILEALKAMSDETRFKIINMLLEHNFCVKALARRLNLSEAAISQHLKVLREAGLVKGEKKGYYTHYTVNRDILYNVSESIKRMAEPKVPQGQNCNRFTDKQS